MTNDCEDSDSFSKEKKKKAKKTTFGKPAPSYRTVNVRTKQQTSLIQLRPCPPDPLYSQLPPTCAQSPPSPSPSHSFPPIANSMIETLPLPPLSPLLSHHPLQSPNYPRNQKPNSAYIQQQDPQTHWLSLSAPKAHFKFTVNSIMIYVLSFDKSGNRRYRCRRRRPCGGESEGGGEICGYGVEGGRVRPGGGRSQCYELFGLWVGVLWGFAGRFGI